RDEAGLPPKPYFFSLIDGISAVPRRREFAMSSNSTLLISKIIGTFLTALCLFQNPVHARKLLIEASRIEPSRSTTVITASEIEKSGATTVADLLRDVPGVELLR